MSFFSNLRIGQRLALGFLALIVLMVMLTVVGIQRVRAIDQRLTQINDVNSVKQRYAINFRGSVHDRAIALRDVVLMDTTADRQAAGMPSTSSPPTTPARRSRWMHCWPPRRTRKRRTSCSRSRRSSSAPCR